MKKLITLFYFTLLASYAVAGNSKNFKQVCFDNGECISSTSAFAASGTTGGGYALEPATVTIQANKGIKLSTASITTLSPGILQIVATSSDVTSGQVSLSTNVIGNLSVNNLNGGSGATGSTFWRGDGTWGVPAGGGGASSLAVGTGTASNFTSLITSPTFVISALGSQFSLTSNGTTNFFALNTSSVTLYGPNIPAASISAGSLGASVLASSFPVTGVGPGTFPLATVTVTRQGLITSISSSTVSIPSSLTLGTGTATNFTMSVTSPTYVISALGSQFNLTTNGTTGFLALNPSSVTLHGPDVVGRLFVSTVNYTISNSSGSDVSIIPAGIGNRTLPANYWYSGKTVRIRAAGVYSSTTVTPGFMTIKVKYGSIIISTSTTFLLTASQTNQVWLMNASFTCQTTGATGTVINNGFAGFYDTTNLLVPSPMADPTGTTIDTTSSNALDVTARFTVPSTLNSITTTNLTILDW